MKILIKLKHRHYFILYLIYANMKSIHLYALFSEISHFIKYKFILFFKLDLLFIIINYLFFKIKLLIHLLFLMI